jgi:WD40 repeat protein
LLTDRYGDPLAAGAVARFGTVRLRHSGEVDSVALSPDGKLIASTASWNTGRVWDAATGQELPRFKRKLRANVVAFAPDGKTLLAGTDNCTVQEWDVASGTLKGEATLVAKDHFHALVTDFSPDRKLLVLGNHGSELRLMDVASGKQVLRLQKASGLLSAAVSHDGKTLATGGQDNIVRLWDVGSGRLLREMPGHQNWVVAVCFTPNGKLLASCSHDSMRLWDVATGKQLREVPDGGVKVAFSPDSKMLARPFHDTIRLWDVEAGRELRQLKGHRSWVIPDLTFSADGKQLVTGGRDSTVVLWDVATGERLHHFEGHQGAVKCLAFSPDGKRLASGGSEDHTLLIWDVAAAKPLHRCPGHDPWVLCVAYSPDGKTIATSEGSNGQGDTECQIRLWDLAEGRLLREFFGHLNSVQSLAYSPDGRTLASSGWDARVRLWDVASGKRLGQIRGPDIRKCVAFTPDGKTLLVANSQDGGVSRYGVDSAAKVGEFGTTDNQRPQVPHAAFYAGGKTLTYMQVRGGGRQVEVPGRGRVEQDPEVRLWDAGSGKMLHSFLLPVGGVQTDWALALSPDGKLLAIGEMNFGGDSAVQLWDTEGGQPLGKLVGHTGAVTALTFAPDGRFLASGSWDTTVLLWDVRQARLCGLWSRLGGEPEAVASAIKALAASPDGVVAFVKERLRQARSREAPYTRLIAELDSDEFGVREKASQQLQRAGADAAFALRLALAGKQSAEVRRRAQELLQKLTAEWESQLQRLLQDFDTPDAEKTEAASRLLQLMGPDAEPYLRRTREAHRFPGRRIKGQGEPLPASAVIFVTRALEQLHECGPVEQAISAPAVLRGPEVLEAIGTTEARRALEELVEGPAGSRVTAEARAALQRLGKRDKAP